MGTALSDSKVVHFSSVTQSCPTLYDPMGYTSPGFSVHHQLPELAQTHVHQISDAIQPSLPLPSPSPQSFPASGSFLMSQFFPSDDQSVGASPSASVLPVNIQVRFPLGWTGWISLLSKGLSRVFSNTTVKSINSSVLSFLIVQLSHPYMTTGKTIDRPRGNVVVRVVCHTQKYNVYYWILYINNY